MKYRDNNNYRGISKLVSKDDSHPFLMPNLKAIVYTLHQLHIKPEIAFWNPYKQ